MDSHTLRTTLRVAQAGSLAATARETGVHPSSVSRQVAALEAELGFTVFERTTRRLHPTEAGRLYLARARAALDLLDEAADAARDVMSAPTGLLRITASAAFAERWLIPHLAGFQSAYPGIELDVVATDDVVDLAGAGIDLAIRLGALPESGSMVVSKLFDTSYHVVASPDYLQRHGNPETPDALSEHDGLMFNLPAFRAGWQFRNSPDAKPIFALPRPALSVSNALALRRAATAGMGVSLLANWTIAEDLATGALVDLFPEYRVSAGDADSAAWILYLSRDYVPARQRVFMDYLKQCTP